MKEQQKKHIIDMMQEDEELGLYDVFNDEKRQGVKELIDAHKQDDENGKPITYWGGLAEPKQETLEDASWKYNPLKKLDGEFLRHAFKEGAKWQQEQIYNQIKELHDNEHITGFSKRAYAQCLDIIEQFKNK